MTTCMKNKQLGSRGRKPPQRHLPYMVRKYLRKGGWEIDLKFYIISLCRTLKTKMLYTYTHLILTFMKHNIPCQPCILVVR